MMARLTLFTLLALSCLSLINVAAHGLRSPHAHAHARPNTHIKQKRCSRRHPNGSSALTGLTDTQQEKPTNTEQEKPQYNGCFPQLGFQMPDSPPKDTSGWWCDASEEYAFLGFSYEISACQSSSQLNKEFADMRNRFNARYVRLYGSCDQNGYYDKIVDAAWNNGLGVHALIWFGFDGSSKWKSRRSELFSTLHNNPKAKFVTRAVQFGSEPLLDGVLPPSELANQIRAAQGELAYLGIPVTTSELQYGFSKDGKASLSVLDAVDLVDAHMLPFFSHSASTAKHAWSSIKNEIEDFWVPKAKGKKIIFSQNGWPSEIANSNQKPNSASAQASVKNEQDYFDMFDDQCSYFKSIPGGGLGWFAHIYSDAQEGGYGVVNTSGKLKFPFSPKTRC